MNEELLLILKGLTSRRIRHRLMNRTPHYIRGFWVIQCYTETILELSQKGSTGEEVG